MSNDVGITISHSSISILLISYGHLCYGGRVLENTSVFKFGLTSATWSNACDWLGI